MGIWALCLYILWDAGAFLRSRRRQNPCQWIAIMRVCLVCLHELTNRDFHHWCTWRKGQIKGNRKEKNKRTVNRDKRSIKQYGMVERVLRCAAKDPADEQLNCTEQLSPSHTNKNSIWGCCETLSFAVLDKKILWNSYKMLHTNIFQSTPAEIAPLIFWGQ